MAAAGSGIEILRPRDEDLDTEIAAALAGFSATPFTEDFDLNKAVAAALADTQPRPLPPQLSPPGTALRAVGRADPQVHSGRPSGPVTATTCPLKPPAPVQLNFGPTVVQLSSRPFCRCLSCEWEEGGHSTALSLPPPAVGEARRVRVHLGFWGGASRVVLWGFYDYNFAGYQPQPQPYTPPRFISGEDGIAEPYGNPAQAAALILRQLAPCLPHTYIPACPCLSTEAAGHVMVMMRELMDGSIHLMLTITPSQHYHALDDLGEVDSDMHSAIKPCAHCGIKLLKSDLPTHKQNCLRYMQTRHKLHTKPPAPTTAKHKKKRGRGGSRRTSNPGRPTSAMPTYTPTNVAKRCSSDPASSFQATSRPLDSSVSPSMHCYPTRDVGDY